MSVRMIAPETTVSMMRKHCVYTIAALGADPDARAFLSVTESWLGRVAEIETQQLALELKEQQMLALRHVANQRLDLVCTRFGEDLWKSVRKDREAARWKAHFKLPVSKFVAQALIEQVALMEQWLTVDDPSIAPHKEEMRKWINTAKEVETMSNDTGSMRASLWILRDRVADDLTRSRDGLRNALSNYALEHDLPRDWANGFFWVPRSERTSKRDDDPTEPTTVPQS